MKILVIALEGQIRDALERQFAVRQRACQCVGPEWFQSGLKQSESSSKRKTQQQICLSIPSDISFVVNTLSLERVSACDEQDHANLASLVEVCSQAKVPLIHLSSSEVYDGEDGGLHREDQPVNPLSTVGVALARMEEQVGIGCERHIILRVGPLFSSMTGNLLTNLLEKLSAGSTLPLSSTSKCAPIHTSDLARVISAIIDQLSCGAECWGAYHYCSADSVTFYQFAEIVVAIASQYTEINSDITESVDDADLVWFKPLMNCNRILNTFGIKQLPWRAFIAPTLKKIYQPNEYLQEPGSTQSMPYIQKENFDE